MKERTVRAGEEELFKSRAREKGRVKIIDLLRARLDAKADAYKAELPSLQLSDIHISDELVNEHDRMLTGGFYAEVTLEYIAALGRGVRRPAVPGRVGAADPDVDPRRARHVRSAAARSFTLDQWRDLLLRSVGFEPARFTRARAGRPHRPHGPVRRAQLQRRRARPARHGQVAPVPAGVAVRASRLRRQGDHRQHVRQQRDRAARPRRPVRRRLLRRGVGRLVRHQGRRQHPQGLHGVRASSAAARRASAPTAAS